MHASREQVYVSSLTRSACAAGTSSCAIHVSNTCAQEQVYASSLTRSEHAQVCLHACVHASDTRARRGRYMCCHFTFPGCVSGMSSCMHASDARGWVIVPAHTRSSITRVLQVGPVYTSVLARMLEASLHVRADRSSRAYTSTTGVSRLMCCLSRA